MPRRPRPAAPRRASLLGVAAFAAAVGASAPARAHGPLHEQLAAIEAQIRQAPNDPEGYLRRGLAYQAHGDHEAALADFERVAKLHPGRPDLDYHKAQALLGAGRPLQAKVLVDRHLKRAAQIPAGYTLRERIFEALGSPREAAADYDRALSLMANPGPDEFLARAAAQLAAKQPEAALRGLEQALGRLGPLITLDLKALEIEESLGRWDAALTRVERLMKPMPRKETWHFRRGQLLARAGRTEEARRAFSDTLAALDALPAHLRGVPAMTELEQKAREALAALDKAAPKRPRRRG